MFNKNQILEKDFNNQSKVIKSKKRVDINILLNKVRQDKKKKQLENSLFFGFVLTAMLATGLVISFN